MASGTIESKLKTLRSGLLTLNAVALIFGICIFALAIWLQSDPAIAEWVSELRMQNYYIGAIIILTGMVIYFLGSALGFLAAYNEHQMALKVSIGVYIFEFIFCVIGAAILLDYSTIDSSIQPVIRKSMLHLISRSQYDSSSLLLTQIQESIGCCGADGPRDYISWRKPLPAECRDSVTGNAYFYGCVDELTWYLEDKSGWLSGLAVILAFLFILKAIFATLLIKVINASKE